MKLHFEENSIVEPFGTEEYFLEKEEYWEVTLPEDYKEFVKKYQGGIPIENCFECEGHEYMVERFLCLFEDYKWHPEGDYHIGVIITQIDFRLIEKKEEKEEVFGYNLIPIALLFAGNFVCLDYRKSKTEPSVCVWDHEESEEFSPVTYYVAESFSKFIELLREGSY